MAKNKKHFVLFLAGGILLGCQSPKPFYAKGEVGWSTISPIPQKQISKTIYLLGDAGESPTKSASVLNTIKNHIDADGLKSNIIFLGDNIYPKGLPEEQSNNRDQAETRIHPQLELAKQVSGNAYFLPGNHDWERGKKNGLNTLFNEEDYIEAFLNNGNTFLPDSGCPGPIVIDLDKNLVLVAIDVQYWLHRHEKATGEKICLSFTKADFIQKIKSIIRESRGKTILMVAHHPLHSNGNHGGYFSLKSHLFPLTDIHPVLFFPLPVLGTIYVMGRKYFGTNQDLAHPQYKAFIKEMKNALMGCKNLIYASGHEHNLQYFEIGKYHTIISGSASKTTWAARKKEASFTYASKGFAKMIFTKENEVWVEFWVPSENHQLGRLVFRKNIIGLD